MTECPDKLEPLSDSDMLLFIKLTLQDVLSGVAHGDLLDLDTIKIAIKYTIALKEKQ